MDIYLKIAAERKRKGLTQEQLADRSNITVRTIQRIENGQTVPRSYTLQTIAAVLDIPFSELIQNDEETGSAANSTNILTEADSKHFLEVLCLSCFSYIVIPFIHVFIPARMLKKSGETNPKVLAFAKKLIRTQLYWKAAFWFLMLATLAFNLISAANFQKAYIINYLWPFLGMYLLNAIIIARNIIAVKKTDFSL